MNGVRVAVALCTLALAARLPIAAEQPRVLELDPADLANGAAESVLVTLRGRVAPAPALTRLGPKGPLADAAQAWSVDGDPRGAFFVATGPDGKVVRVGPEGATILAGFSEPLVTALVRLPGGDLLAATAPGGKIYRVDSAGHARVFCETGEQYVWALALAPDGTIHAATGDRGILLAIDRSGNATPELDSGEPHLTVLALLRDGAIAVGSAGSGKIFRVARNEPARVLYEGDLAEVSDLAVEPDGSLVAGFLAGPEPDPRPPAVRIQVAGGASRSPSDTVADMDDRGAPSLEGIIEGLPAASESRTARRSRGRLVRISPSGAAKDLWRSTSEAVFAVAIDPEGRVVFGTGEPARVYRISEGEDVERLATLAEAQVTAIASAANGLLLATSNPAGAYRLEGHPAERASFVSTPLDAEAPARWGALRFRPSSGATGDLPELQARTGNSATPDATWSDWGRAVTTPNASLGVPDARFLQWRAQWRESMHPAGIEGLAVSFMPRNRPPVLDSFRIDASKTSFSGKVPFRWSATDPDGDPLAIEVQYRSAGAAEWTTALRVEPKDAGGEGDSDEIDGKGSWDASAVAEGRYEVRALVSDETGNPAGTGTRVPSYRTFVVTLDRTPPELRVRRTAGGGAEVAAEDSLSPVGCLELTEANKTVHSVAPEDGVCDATHERFLLGAGELDGEVPRTLRLSDAAGNVAASTLDPGGKP